MRRGRGHAAGVPVPGSARDVGNEIESPVKRPMRMRCVLWPSWRTPANRTPERVAGRDRDDQAIPGRREYAVALFPSGADALSDAPPSPLPGPARPPGGARTAGGIEAIQWSRKQVTGSPRCSGRPLRRRPGSGRGRLGDRLSVQRFVIAALAEMRFKGRRNPQPHPVAIEGAGGQEFGRALRGMGGRTVAVVLREQYGRAPDVEVRSHRKRRIGRLRLGVTPRRPARCIADRRSLDG